MKFFFHIKSSIYTANKYIILQVDSTTPSEKGDSSDSFERIDQSDTGLL